MRTVIVLILSCAVAAAEIIPATNQVDWSAAGVLGGVPYYTNAITVTDPPYSADNTGATDCHNAITNAIANCPTHSAVYFPTGTYYLSKSINLGPNYGAAWAKPVVLRGADPTTTKIISASATSHAIVWWGTAKAASNLLTSGFTFGSTSVEAQATTGLSAGDAVLITQTNDPAIMIGDFHSSTANHVGQVNVLTNIDGTTLSLLRPLYYEYNGSLEPYIQRFTAATNFGLENLTIECTNTAASTVRMVRAMDCWVTNCVVTNLYSYGINLDSESFRCTIQHSRVAHWGGVGSSGYAISMGGHTTDNLIADNITGDATAGVLLIGGCSGNVIAYNYNYHGRTNVSSMSTSYVLHGDGANMNLIEGNYGARAKADEVWGCNFRNTFFRNFCARVDPVEGPNIPPDTRDGLRVDSTNYYQNVVGNVVGVSGQLGSGLEDYYFGWNDGGSIFDEGTTNTMVFHGNYSYETETTQWDENIADHSIPASMFLSAAPAWWNSDLWPPIGPDRYPYVGSIPARDRFLGIVRGTINIQSGSVGTIYSKW